MALALTEKSEPARNADQKQQEQQQSPIIGHTKPYEYNDSDQTSPTRRTYHPGGFRYDEDPNAKNRDSDSSQLSPNSQTRRATGLAFNYAPGEEDKLKEQAEKRKAGELSPKSKDRAATGRDGSPVKGPVGKSYSPNSGRPVEIPGTPGTYRAYDPTLAFIDNERAKTQMPMVAGEPTKKRVKILVIVSKFDPKTKRIDSANGLVEHSTGILDTTTGKIESKYGVIDPKKGTVEAHDTRSGKPETVQAVVDSKSGNLHLTSGVADPATGKVDDSLGQIICIAPQDNPIVEIVAVTGKIDPNSGRIDTVNGDIERTRGTLNVKTGFIDTKYGRINPKTGEVKTIDPKSGKATSRPAKLDTNTGHITISGAIDPKTGKLDNNIGHLIAIGSQIDPIIEVTTLSGKLDLKKSIIEPKTLTIDNSTGQLDPNTGRIDTKYGQFNLVKHTLLAADPKSGKIDSKDIKIDPVSGQIIIKNAVNPKTGKPEKDYGQIVSLKIVNKLIDPTTGKVVMSSDGKDIVVDPKTNQIWVAQRKDPKTGETIYTSSQIDPKTGVVITIYGYLNPKSNEIERQTKLDPNLTKIDPTNGQVYSATGEIDEVSGEPLFAVSQYDPDSGDVYTKIGRVDPKTGKIVIIRFVPITKKADAAAGESSTTPSPTKDQQTSVRPASAASDKVPASPSSAKAFAVQTPKQQPQQQQQHTPAPQQQPRIAKPDDAFIPVAAPAVIQENPFVEVLAITGKVDAKTGKLDAKNGDIERTRGLVNLQTGFVQTKYGQINPTTGEIKSVNDAGQPIDVFAAVDPVTGQITVSNVVNPKTGKQDPSIAQLITIGSEIDPIVEVTTISGKYDSKKGVIDPKTIAIERSIGNLDKETGKIDTKLGQFDLKSHLLTFPNPKTGKPETKEVKIDPIVGQLLLRNEVNPKSGKVDKDYAKMVSLRIVQKRIDPKTGNIVTSTDPKEVIINAKTQQIWIPDGVDPINGATIYSSSQVDPKTGYIITLYGYLNPKTNEIERQSLAQSNITKIDPTTGQLLTATGNVDEATGEPLYAATQIDPESGEVYTKVGKIDPKTGKLILIRIVLITKKDQQGRPQIVDPKTCDIDPVTGRINNIFSKTVYVYNMVDPVTGEIIQVDPNDPRVAGARTTVTQTMTLTGEIDPVTGRIKTEYGHIDPDTGDIDPETAVTDPVTGKLILNYAQIDPSHFGKSVSVTKETVPISRTEFFDGIKHMGKNALRRDSEASSDDDVEQYAADVTGSPASGDQQKVSKYMSTPTVVKTTTKQVLTKNEDGVTHNVEEEIRNLGTGEVMYSTQEHKVSIIVY